MRIIAGRAGRVAIKVPSAVARPTTDFVRQALFSILGETVHDARVLDLFAGSGALGLEALSRGAASCTFVDEHRQACAIIPENLKKARLDAGRVELHGAAVERRGGPGAADGRLGRGDRPVAQIGAVPVRPRQCVAGGLGGVGDPGQAQQRSQQVSHVRSRYRRGSRCAAVGRGRTLRHTNRTSRRRL